MAKNTKKSTQSLQEEARNELAVQGQSGELMSADQSQQYYSIIPQNRKEAVQVYNAINNPDERLADFINKQIKVKHILIETVVIVKENCDDPFEDKDIVPRTVIIDENGISYVAVSFGIFNSMKRIVAMFGEPNTWEEPVTIEVKQIKKGQNSILTLNIVG